MFRVGHTCIGAPPYRWCFSTGDAKVNRTILDRVKVIACAVAAIGFSASCAFSQPIIAQSTFDTDTEGWSIVRFSTICGTLLNPVSGTVTWNTSGGSPGGFLRTPELTNTSFWRAPAAFRGNLSALFGGSIRFEQRLSTTNNNLFYALDDVYLQGGGLTLIADAINSSRDSWGETRVPLLPGYWRVGNCTGPFATEQQIRTTLTDVQQWHIRAESVNGSETNDLDTVVLDSTPVSTSCEGRWEERDSSAPSGRWRHAIAVDTDRNVMVLFGGNTGESDTWEYGLASGIWTRTQSPVSPTRRGDHAMVYDISRQRIVLTGGNYLGTTLAEVWEYDVATDIWTQGSPLPQPRSGHSMSYDSARNTIVLYGGLNSGLAGAVDVLERSATSPNWLARSSAVNPGPQIGYAMAYDASRQRTVLIGEGTTAVSLAEWDGVAGTWALRSFSGLVPNARANPAVTYDVSRAVIVLCGGEASRSTWEYNGTSWLQRALIPVGGRDQHSIAYDSLNQRILLSGGILNSATPQRDLLSFNGAENTWSTVWSRTTFGPRDLFGMCYDEIGLRCVAQGGALVTRPGIVQQFGANTLTFDGTIWSSPTSSGSPGTRSFHSLVYDPARRYALLYGGAIGSGDSTATSRLWQLNLNTMTWTDFGPQLPGARYDHASAFDRLRNQLVVHGGIDDAGNRIGSSWIYDVTSGQWNQVGLSGPNPGLRNGSSMAFDENRGVIVLFAGRVGSTNQYDNSTWEWNGTAWSNRTPVNGNPPARLRPKLVYDSDRRTTIMFGGVTNTNGSLDDNGLYASRPYRDVWEWDGTHWDRILIDDELQPVGLVYGGAAYDRSRKAIVHHGGSSVTNGTYRNGQTWDLILPDRNCGGSFCDSIDFNNDGALFDPTDVDAFLSVYSEGPCIPLTATCNDIDFNNDGSLFDPCDVDSFLLVYSEGPCTPCGQ